MGSKVSGRRRRARRAARAALVAAAIAGPLVVRPGPEVWSYPLLTDSCFKEELGFTFAGPSWTPALQQYWLNGARKWNGYRGSGGQPYRFFADLGNYEFVRRTDLGGLVRGETACYFGLGEIDFTLDDGVTVREEVEHVAAHETGHGFGLEHAGKDDSFGDDNPPMMATCGAAGSSQTALSRDDFGSLQNQAGDSQHPNGHFENGYRYWGTSNLDVSWASSGGDTGGSHVTVERTAEEPASIFQTMRLEHPVEHKAHASYKSTNTSEPGASVRIVLEARRVEFSGDHRCVYRGGIDYINPSYPDGSAFQTVASTTVGADVSSWTYALTAGWVSPSSWEAVDLRVRVYKRGNTPLNLDDLGSAAIGSD